MARRIGKLIKMASDKQPVNKLFLRDVMAAIEKINLAGRRKPTKTYKPSSFSCLRQMYYQIIGAEIDKIVEPYNGIGMADTGTRRHEAIQGVLTKMDSLGFRWEYMDVGEYIEAQQRKGKCKDIVVRNRRGYEVALFHSGLNMSFMCDGIIRDNDEGEYYLFEFKNQASFKYRGKEHIDKEHEDQVSAYCMALELDRSLVLYENRDTCELECPEVFEVTEEMKKKQVAKILECDSYVAKNTPPPKTEDKKLCRWCKYKTVCGEE